MRRIISINLNGIRSAQRKGFFDWMLHQQADVVCVQELKAQAADMTAEMLAPTGYQASFSYAEKKGYSGVGVYYRGSPLAVATSLGEPMIDTEGRYVAVQFAEVTVVSLYLPSGSSGEERQGIKFAVMERLYPHLQRWCNSGREIIICGDWNIAHREIDLKNWRGNQKNSGFLPEERDWMTRIFSELGWVDVYRALYPDTAGESYTWWSNRGQAWLNNVGWRIDYQVATPGIARQACAASIYKAERFSDHAPLTVDYRPG